MSDKFTLFSRLLETLVALMAPLSYCQPFLWLSIVPECLPARFSKKYQLGARNKSFCSHQIILISSRISSEKMNLSSSYLIKISKVSSVKLKAQKWYHPPTMRLCAIEVFFAERLEKCDSKSRFLASLMIRWISEASSACRRTSLYYSLY